VGGQEKERVGRQPGVRERTRSFLAERVEAHFSLSWLPSRKHRIRYRPLQRFPLTPGGPLTSQKVIPGVEEGVRRVGDVRGAGEHVSSEVGRGPTAALQPAPGLPIINTSTEPSLTQTIYTKWQAESVGHLPRERRGKERGGSWN